FDRSPEDLLRRVVGLKPQVLQLAENELKQRIIEKEKISDQYLPDLLIGVEHDYPFINSEDYPSRPVTPRFFAGISWDIASGFEVTNRKAEKNLEIGQTRSLIDEI